MNVTVNINDDTLHLAFPHPGEKATGSRVVAAVALLTSDGKLVGLDIPNMGRNLMEEESRKEVDASQIYDKAAAERAFAEWRKLHPPVEAPEGKPFNLANVPRLDLSDEECEEIISACESARVPEPWRNPWDLP